MNILRKFALFIFGLLLFIALPLNTLNWTTQQSLMDRSVILGWLREGKVYDNIADTAAQLAEESLTNKDTAQTPEGEETQKDDGQMPDTATLIKAAKTALPPNVLQENVEALINSAYDWLEGKTDTIVLNLDLSDEKKAFIDALGNEAISRAASLPTCTAEQVGDFDPLSSDCIPAGTNVAAQAEKIKSELASSKDFLPDTNITGADLTVGEEGAKKLISEEFKVIPQAYKNAKNSTLIFTASLVVFALLIFFLGKTRKSGLKINAWIFGLSGLWTLLLGLLFRLGNSTLVEQILSNSDTNIGASAVAALFAQITSTLSNWHFIIGGAYVAVTIVCIIAIKLMGNKNKPVAGDKNNNRATPQTPNSTEPQKPKTTTAQKPQANKPKKPTLVQ